MPDKVRRHPCPKVWPAPWPPSRSCGKALVDGKPLAAALTHCDDLAEELYCLESRGYH